MGGFQIVFPDNNINTLIFWLVVWNIWIIFPYIGNVIILTDFHIFQRGRSTTNQIFYLFDKVFSPLNGAFPLGPT
jgi:hypothetical protein